VSGWRRWACCDTTEAVASSTLFAPAGLSDAVTIVAVGLFILLREYRLAADKALPVLTGNKSIER